MYDLYEYISECAITATLSDLIYMYHSSCSVALTVRLTLAERAQTYLLLRRFLHISHSRVHGFHSTSSFLTILSRLTAKRLMRARHRAAATHTFLYPFVPLRDCRPYISTHSPQQNEGPGLAWRGARFLGRQSSLFMHKQHWLSQFFDPSHPSSQSAVSGIASRAVTCGANWTRLHPSATSTL
jgi:hypothetical protein